MITKINRMVKWLMAGVFISCVSEPKDAVMQDQLPAIYPDYIGVTIPAEIAPLNFNVVDREADAVDVVVRGSKGGELHVQGDFADFGGGEFVAEFVRGWKGVDWDVSL